jgi:low temperature requirement protein LtrA
MVANFGISLGGGDGATMIRASYGGFLIGEGLLFAWCAASPARARFGLVAVVLLTLPILLSRLLGMALDGAGSPYHRAYVAIELVGVCLALFMLHRNER